MGPTRRRPVSLSIEAQQTHKAPRGTHCDLVSAPKMAILGRKMVDVGSLQKHVLTGLEGVLGYWLVTIVMIFGDYMVECPTSLYDDDHHHHHHLPLRSEALVAILVMYSRWHLGVHTFEQLVVGGSVGGCLGYVFYSIYCVLFHELSTRSYIFSK